jgi:hypothetical protein
VLLHASRDREIIFESPMKRLQLAIRPSQLFAMLNQIRAFSREANYSLKPKDILF